MGQAAFDISVLGDKELDRTLARLERKVQRKLISKAMRNSTKRLRPWIAAAAPVDTGALKNAITKMKIRSAGNRNLLRLGLIQPEEAREAIKLNFWEYGSKDGRVPPKAFVRRTVDAHADAEYKRIGKEIGEAIEREARK